MLSGAKRHDEALGCNNPGDAGRFSSVGRCAVVAVPSAAIRNHIDSSMHRIFFTRARGARPRAHATCELSNVYLDAAASADNLLRLVYLHEVDAAANETAVAAELEAVSLQLHRMKAVAMVHDETSQVEWKVLILKAAHQPALASMRATSCCAISQRRAPSSTMRPTSCSPVIRRRRKEAVGRQCIDLLPSCSARRRRTSATGRGTACCR